MIDFVVGKSCVSDGRAFLLIDVKFLKCVVECAGIFSEKYFVFVKGAVLIMGDIAFEIEVFKSEIIILLDQGESISVEELENISDKEDIVEYIGKKYGFKNINSTPENQKLLKAKLKDIYISEQKARDSGIENNGLIYLLDILFEMMNTERFELFEQLESYIDS